MDGNWFPGKLLRNAHPYRNINWSEEGFCDPRRFLAGSALMQSLDRRIRQEKPR
jgi:hypothetical protein